MRIHRLSALAFVSVLVSAVTLATRTPSSGQTAPAYTAYDVAQGQYLVQVVARCTGCHGADLGGVTRPADAAFVPRPKIAGLPMFRQDGDAVAFFTDGTLPGGRTARPPMPPYRLKPNDAMAVVAYLRSLK